MGGSYRLLIAALFFVCMQMKSGNHRIKTSARCEITDCETLHVQLRLQISNIYNCAVGNLIMCTRSGAICSRKVDMVRTLSDSDILRYSGLPIECQGGCQRLVVLCIRLLFFFLFWSWNWCWLIRVGDLTFWATKRGFG